jgi:ABC-type sulfate/molybdate transport systems ATPase subunit
VSPPSLLLESPRGRDLLIEHVSLARGGGVVLDDVSFGVEAGTAVVIRGRSGSGKSTLLRVLAGLTRADAGRVLLGGRDVTTLTPEAHRRAVGFVAQQAAMFPGTVADNLRRGPRFRDTSLPVSSPADRSVAAWLATVGLSADFGEREAAQLSGGERQRVALARALANTPAVLLLDEPTAALDPEGAAEIVKLLGHLVADGLGLLVVTHDASLAPALGAVVFSLEAGRLTPSPAS